MRPEIAVQFSTTVNSLSNWASIIIRHMSHSPFSHVDLEMLDGTLLGASDSPKAAVLSGNPRGVAIRPANYENYGRRCRMVITTPFADAIREAAKSQLGKPFDNSALRGFLSDAVPGDRNWQATDSWFCSELVIWSFATANYWGSNIPSVWPKNRISPSDILMIFLFDPNWRNREIFWSGTNGSNKMDWLEQAAKLQAQALYTPAEAVAAMTALKVLEQSQVPWYEQAAITDDLLNAIIATVLTAAAKARKGDAS
jgi:hypothetical protein